MFAKRALLSMVCGLAVWGGAIAQAADWIGKRVMPRSEMVMLRRDGAVVGDVYSIQWPAVVKTIDGSWLWLADDGGTSHPAVSGWVRANEVIPINEAIDFVDGRLSSVSPTSADAVLFWIRGIFWESAQEHALAAKDYQKAVALRPSNREARMGLARATAKSKYDESLYAAAAQWNPACPRFFVDWGQALETDKQHARAQQMYVKSQGLNENWRMPHYALGQLASNNGNHTEALGHFEDAIRCDAMFHAAHRGRAAALLANKSDAKASALALVSARKACECCYYRNADCLSTLAEAYAAAKQWSEAARFEQMAVDYSTFDNRSKFQTLLDKYVDAASPPGAAGKSPPATDMAATDAPGSTAPGAKRGDDPFSKIPIDSDADPEAAVREAARRAFRRPAFVDRSGQRVD